MNIMTNAFQISGFGVKVGRPCYSFIRSMPLPPLPHFGIPTGIADLCATLFSQFGAARRAFTISLPGIKDGAACRQLAIRIAGLWMFRIRVYAKGQMRTHVMREPSAP